MHHLINNFSINDACKERIRQIEYTNYGSFFHYKGNSYYTLTPAAELSRYITQYGQTNDTLLKWFILIYSIASVNDIYKSHIYQYAVDRIKANREGYNSYYTLVTMPYFDTKIANY